MLHQKYQHQENCYRNNMIKSSDAVDSNKRKFLREKEDS